MSGDTEISGWKWDGFSGRYRRDFGGGLKGTVFRGDDCNWNGKLWAEGTAVFHVSGADAKTAARFVEQAARDRAKGGA
jgi:hypothetical protein